MNQACFHTDIYNQILLEMLECLYENPEQMQLAYVGIELQTIQQPLSFPNLSSFQDYCHINQSKHYVAIIDINLFLQALQSKKMKNVEQMFFYSKGAGWQNKIKVDAIWNKRVYQCWKMLEHFLAYRQFGQYRQPKILPNFLIANEQNELNELAKPFMLIMNESIDKQKTLQSNKILKVQLDKISKCDPQLACNNEEDKDKIINILISFLQKKQWFQDQGNIIKTLIQNEKLLRQCIEIYTQYNFVYKYLNNIYRVNYCSQYAKLFLPYSKILFNTILLIQKDQQLQQFTCWRGGQMLKSQFNNFKKGQIVQNPCYLSTSLQEETAKKFKDRAQRNKYLLKITVKVSKENLGKSGYGFANISKFSQLKEDQVVFNPLNLFKVVEISEISEGEFYLEFEYLQSSNEEIKKMRQMCNISDKPMQIPEISDKLISQVPDDKPMQNPEISDKLISQVPDDKPMQIPEISDKLISQVPDDKPMQNPEISDKLISQVPDDKPMQIPEISDKLISQVPDDKPMQIPEISDKLISQVPDDKPMQIPEISDKLISQVPDDKPMQNPEISDKLISQVPDDKPMQIPEISDKLISSVPDDKPMQIPEISDKLISQVPDDKPMQIPEISDKLISQVPDDKPMQNPEISDKLISQVPDDKPMQNPEISDKLISQVPDDKPMQNPEISDKLISQVPDDKPMQNPEISDKLISQVPDDKPMQIPEISDKLISQVPDDKPMQNPEISDKLISQVPDDKPMQIPEISDKLISQVPDDKPMQNPEISDKLISQVPDDKPMQNPEISDKLISQVPDDKPMQNPEISDKLISQVPDDKPMQIPEISDKLISQVPDDKPMQNPEISDKLISQVPDDKPMQIPEISDKLISQVPDDKPMQNPEISDKLISQVPDDKPMQNPSINAFNTLFSQSNLSVQMGQNKQRKISKNQVNQINKFIKILRKLKIIDAIKCLQYLSTLQEKQVPANISKQINTFMEIVDDLQSLDISLCLEHVDNYYSQSILDCQANLLNKLVQILKEVKAFDISNFSNIYRNPQKNIISQIKQKQNSYLNELNKFANILIKVQSLDLPLWLQYAFLIEHHPNASTQQINFNELNNLYKSKQGLTKYDKTCYLQCLSQVPQESLNFVSTDIRLNYCNILASMLSNHPVSNNLQNIQVQSILTNCLGVSKSPAQNPLQKFFSDNPMIDLRKNCENLLRRTSKHSLAEMLKFSFYVQFNPGVLFGYLFDFLAQQIFSMRNLQNFPIFFKTYNKMRTLVTEALNKAFNKGIISNAKLQSLKQIIRELKFFHFLCYLRKISTHSNKFEPSLHKILLQQQMSPSDSEEETEQKRQRIAGLNRCRIRKTEKSNLACTIKLQIFGRGNNQ